MRKKLLIACVCVFAALSTLIFIMTNGLSAVGGETLTGIDLANAADGRYTGFYEHGRWANTVAVQVKDHKITDISIIKDVFGAQVTNCSGEVFRRVIEAQDTKVDTVSGATVTSKAYLKAIEDALAKSG